MKAKLPHSVYNWISLTGATIAIISLFMIVFLFAITTFFERGTSYLGLVVYILLPAVLIAGLLLIPLGMYLKVRKEKKSGIIKPSQWPSIDLNDPRHRNAFMIFIIGTTIFLFVSALGSYEAFHYTESVEFCGKVCHAVMKPEFTAYQYSPHARVACVACHVGSGADWYVRSKLSGLYQVYAVTFNTYPKPIPTPISNLRPSREICEECHWPEKFYAQQLRFEKHYLNDENNTAWNIGLLMKIGPEHSALGLQEGIHWHINPDVKIEYAATDDQRQNIPWVRYTNLKTGEVNVYQNPDEPVTKLQLDTLSIRTMDCIDCHNRPSHNYLPPAIFVNDAITSGSIPKELPNIKALSMEICENTYSTSDSAMMFIRNRINEYYNEEYPDIYSGKKDMVNKAIAGLQSAYGKNIFPEMNVRWNVYPNNIGHLEFNGCFRCHNDNHISEKGKVISKDCNLCHTINMQGNPDSLMVANVNQTQEFVHPSDIGDSWKEMLCVDCHTGLNP